MAGLSAGPGPKEWTRVGTGPLHKRRPRNTCQVCNNGWMSRIESSSFPVARALILGEQRLLTTFDQLMLASVLSLISARMGLIARKLKSLPQEELSRMRVEWLPSGNWAIWIAKHDGNSLKDYLYEYSALHIVSDPSAPTGADFCNTYVITLIVGQLYAHLVYSNSGPFPEYFGNPLTQLWPPTGAYVDAHLLPSLTDDEGKAVHRTIVNGAGRIAR